MTPATSLLARKDIAHTVHQYEHDPSADSYGEEACQALSVDSAQVFKTLVVKLHTGELAVAVVPVNSQLKLKALAKVLGVKKASMAAANEVERSSGYVLGGVSPLAQKKRLATVLDDSARGFETIYVSAGKRGLEIELPAEELRALCQGQFASIAV